MKRSLVASVLAASLSFAAGCAPVSSRTEPPPSGGTVHTYSQGAAGHANIFWINTPSGAILVDTPLLNSEARYLRGQLGIPYRLYVTSPRTDHWASLDILRAGDVPTATTPAIATEIKNYGDQRLATLRKRYGDDVAARVEPPTPAIEERTHDMLSDIEIEIVPLGPADTDSALAIFFPRTGELLAGELVGNNAHVDMTWGRSQLWQDRINELKALEPKIVYPGHGEPGGPELLDKQIEYLKFFHDTVAAHVRPGAPARITTADKQEIVKAIEQRYPKYDRDDILEGGVRGEYAVQLSALPAAASSGPTGEGTAADPVQATPAKTDAPAASSAPAPSAAPAAGSSGAVDDLLGDSKPAKKSKKKKKQTENQ